METLIRKGAKPFYGDNIFSHGLSRCGFFNKREAEELFVFGKSFENLSIGLLLPNNEEEAQFVREVKASEPPVMYCAKLWKKYLNALNKSKSRHGFIKSEQKHIALEKTPLESPLPELSDAIEPTLLID